MPLIAAYLFFAIFSEIPLVSLKFTLVVLTYIAIFFLWQKYHFKSQPYLFIKLMSLFSLSMIVIIFCSIWQYKQYEWNPVTVKGIFRPFFKDHTVFGATSAILAIFWLSMVRTVKSNSTGILYLLSAIFFLYGVILSNSRASFLSLLFSGVVWLLLILKIKFKAVLITTGVLITFLFIFNGRITSLLRENTHLSYDTRNGFVERIKSSGNISSDVSNLERLNRWVSGFRMFSDKPFTGFGPGTYQFTYIPYQKPELMNRLSVKDLWHIPENSGGTAHSEYILALSEMGIVGFLALILIFGRWAWLTFRQSYEYDNKTRIMVQVAFVSLSTYIFHAFFNNFLNTDKFAFLFWGLAAWLCAHYELQTRKQRVKDKAEQEIKGFRI